MALRSLRLGTVVVVATLACSTVKEDAATAATTAGDSQEATGEAGASTSGSGTDASTASAGDGDGDSADSADAPTDGTGDGDGDASASGDGDGDGDGDEQFACGSLLCDVATAYCSEVFAGPGGVAYDCVPAPTACVPNPTCPCLEAEGVYDSSFGECATAPGGGTTVTLYLP